MEEKKSEVRCPGCKWTPESHHSWYCLCGHSWNTFETGGICPGCKKGWDKTQCPACDHWSDHADWYPSLKKQLKHDLASKVNKQLKPKFRKRIKVFQFTSLHNVSFFQRKNFKLSYELFRIPPLKN